MVCLECGKELLEISWTHLKKCCGLTIAEYRVKYNVFKTTTDRSGPNNNNWKNIKIKTCIDCGVNIEKRGRSKRCHSCEGLRKTGNGNSFYGKVHSEESRRKIKESHKTRDKSTYYKIPNTEDIKNKRRNTLKERWKLMTLEEKHRRLKNFIKTGSQSKKMTSIEEKINNILITFNMIEGEDYNRNVQMGGYNVDFLLDKRYIIECYGDYWHKHPDSFFDEESDKKRQKDKVKRIYLEEKGYYFINLWERDINNNIIEIEILLEKFLGHFFALINWESCYR